MIESPITIDPFYYNPPNPSGLAEAYLRNVWRSVHERGFSYLCTLTGRHRVGKSLVAIAFARLLDSTYWENMETRTIYTGDQFFEATEDIEQNKIKGGAIVWDEANLGISSRDWYTLANRCINHAVQAMGYLKPLIFFVTQDVTFIDSQPRKMFHSFFEVDRKNTQFSNVKPFDIRFNKRTGKMFYYYPRFSGRYKGGSGPRIIMKPMRVMKPPRDIIKRYRTHSEPMKKRLMKQMKDIMASIKTTSDKKDQYRLSEEEIIAHVMGEKENPLFITRDGTFRVETIARDFKIPFAFARRIKIQADAKLQDEMATEE